MDPATRFGELINRPQPEAHLDLLVALVGASFDRRAGVDDVLRELDRLAQRCPATFEGIVDTLFGSGLLKGNGREYSDPRNSYLHEVLRRGLGLPITLSVIAIEIGRRLDVPIVGVGLPSHFVIGLDGSERFADPFNGGLLYDPPQLTAVWQQITGSPASLSPAMLTATPARSVVLRILNNLKQTFVHRDDHASLGVLAGLRGAFPELAHEHAEHARWMRHWN